jgi:hypothetical protein
MKLWWAKIDGSKSGFPPKLNVGTDGISSSWARPCPFAFSFRDEVLLVDEMLELFEWMAFAFENGDSRGWSKSTVRPWTEPARVRRAGV